MARVVAKWNDEEQDWHHQRLNQIQGAEVLRYHGYYIYLLAAQCIKLEKMLSTAGGGDGLSK